ncbi:branched-chain amino acid ABC transporter permease [Pusillimonas sp. DMV24BSW_D]|uniref:branched-chain amino acid ABC transporter permease n=1 Tax=Neopusillimonas aestuarii TaxID=2716226 RepID=UPI001409DA8F|nr:branched-chain amino acid ABC transporter permease [Pusillimonas sp. DMV24BSW_D]QIM50320.1 branched-chain amino acid ABC transporter permease [Pusillimonas sp. DMV24BSW_D]
MNATIAILLIQDGLTNGLLYALIALSILQVFLVTKVLWLPAGELVAFGALTMGVLNTENVPGTVWLLPCIGLAALLSWCWTAWRTQIWHGVGRQFVYSIIYPVLVSAIAWWASTQELSAWVRGVLTLLLVAPMGPLLYTAVFRPILHTSILTKLIVAVALHVVLVGAGLFFFGPEGLRSAPLIAGRIDVGFTRLSYQLVVVAVVSIVLMLGLWAYFERTLWGKALRATAMNRLGARLAAVRIETAGLIAFGLAGFIGALAGVLISPITTIYYDSGFLLGLKGFIGVVCAGMVSFPLAVLGALGVGLLDAFASFYASSFRDVIVFAALVPVLMWRSLYVRHEDDES